MSCLQICPKPGQMVCLVFFNPYLFWGFFLCFVWGVVGACPPGSRSIATSESQIGASGESWGWGEGQLLPSGRAFWLATQLISLTRDTVVLWVLPGFFLFLFLWHFDWACWLASLLLCCWGAKSQCMPLQDLGTPYSPLGAASSAQPGPRDQPSLLNYPRKRFPIQPHYSLLLLQGILLHCNLTPRACWDTPQFLLQLWSFCYNSF